MMHAQELTKSLKPATTAAVAGAAVLTWFFSAMQCNKEYCYTTDNPVTQVALAATLATATIMAATSSLAAKLVTPYAAPVTEKLNQAKTYLEGIFASKKAAEVKTVDVTPVKNSTTEQEEGVLARTGSELFSPKSDSVQANASDTTHSAHSTPSPSPTHS